MALQAGVIHLTLEFATGLKDKDWFGKQDPYAVLQCGSQRFRSRTATDGGKNPVWNQQFSFSVINENDIAIEVFDEDVASRNDIIGRGMITLSGARQRYSDRQQVHLVSKSGKSAGMVNVSLTFQPNGPPQQAHGAAPGYGYPPPGGAPHAYPPQPYAPPHGAPPPGAYGAPPPHGYPPHGAPGGYPPPAYPPPHGAYPPPAHGAYPPPAPGAYPPPAHGAYPPPHGAPGYPPAPYGAAVMTHGGAGYAHGHGHGKKHKKFKKYKHKGYKMKLKNFFGKRKW